MTEQQERKQHIRAFMQMHYTDERLAQLLAHARDGKLAYVSCCCFIGIPTATHPLQAELGWLDKSTAHYSEAKMLSGAIEAEQAYELLCDYNAYLRYAASGPRDALRRRILIPMIRAEMKRREIVQAKQELAQMQKEAMEEFVNA